MGLGDIPRGGGLNAILQDFRESSFPCRLQVGFSIQGHPRRMVHNDWMFAALPQGWDPRLGSLSGEQSGTRSWQHQQK